MGPGKTHQEQATGAKHPHMFSRSHRSQKTQGFAKDEQGKGRSAHRSLLAELGLVSSSNSSTSRSPGSSSWGTDLDRPSYKKPNSTISARSYGALLHPDKSKLRLSALP